MIKKIRLISHVEYTLNEEEGELFKNCLQYVKHRITKHPTCGARVIGLEKVDKMLNEFNN